MGKKNYDKIEPMTIEKLAGTIDGLTTSIDGLTTRVDARFDMLEKKITEDVEYLARITAGGFAELKSDMRDEFLPRFNRLEHKMDAVRSDISGLVYDGKKMKRRVEHLEESEFGSIQEA